MESHTIPSIGAYQLQSTSRRTVKQYRPVSTRPWVLFLFLTATGLCFGLLIAVSRVERQTSINTKRDVGSLEERRGQFRRQDGSASATETYQSTTTASEILSLAAQATVTTTSQPSSDTKSASSIVSSASSAASSLSALLSLTSQSTIKATSSTTIRVSATTAVLSLTSQSTSTTKSTTIYASATTAVLSLTSQSTAKSATPPVTASASATALLSLTSKSTTTASTPLIASTTVVLSLTSQTTKARTSSSSAQSIATSTDLLSMTASQGNPTNLAPNALGTTQASASNVLSLSSTTPTANAYPLDTITAPLLISTSIIEDATGSIDALASTDSLSSSSPTESWATESNAGTAETASPTASVTKETASSASANTRNDTNSVDPAINADLFLIKIAFKNYYYFFAMYLPKLLAVIMSTIWSIIFANLKLMEPFYQLSARSGAFAKDTMFGNYLSTSFTLSSLSATSRGQWVLILGGTVFLAWIAVVALVSELMTVISTGECTAANGTKFRCAPGWAVNRQVLDILIGLVGLIFALVFILALLVSRRRRSGVFTNPSSIASMAELLGNPAVMHDLQEVDPSATEREVRMLIGENRYKLGFYDIVTGKQNYNDPTDAYDQRYGLIKIAGDRIPQKLASGTRAHYGAVHNPTTSRANEIKANASRRIFQLVYDIIMLLTTIAIFIVVLYYYLDSKSDPLNDFFNSNNFGPRFVLTALALIVTTGWSRTSQEVTLMSTYRSMARATYSPSGVPAGRSILAPVATTPFTAVYNGLVLRNSLVSIVAISAILGDFLLVAVSGVPFTAGQIKPSLQASSFTSLGILGIMAMTSIAVIIHNRTAAGGTRRLPRSPDTLAGVWLYLCGSELVRHNKHDCDEQSITPLNKAELKAKYGGRYYGFARAMGVDGVHRWTVDEAAELQSAKAATVGQEAQYRAEYPSADAPSLLCTASEYSVESDSYDQVRHHEMPNMPIHKEYGRPQHIQYDYPPTMPQQQLYEAQSASPAVRSQPRRFEEFRPRDYTLAQQYGTPQDYRVVHSQLRYSAVGQPQQAQRHAQYPHRTSQASSNGRGYGRGT